MWLYDRGITAGLAAPDLVTFAVSSAQTGATLLAAHTICPDSSGDYVPVRSSATAFALMSVGASLGNTVSPTIGGLPADYVDMRWAFWLDGGGCAFGRTGALCLQT